ncbi:TetR/AcrR family transcriptional regulator C-terminal domain-containing protein [Nocardia sp. NPDC050793]|uniref:TetR/AcrR family transcriptional regulator n=1 Tax=Nocardia sp. NPDC050793 TaxID=3155159 RepID=UPI0033F203DA
MPRPRSLTTDDLGNAALAVIDRDGLEGLTMRAVAKELDIATMGLYRYVADRDRLEVLVVDRVLGAMETAPPEGEDWRARAAVLLARMRAAVAAHPAVVPLILRHRQSSTASLHWMEAMLAVLTAAGFTGRERVIAQRTVVGFLLGFLQNEHYASIAGPGTATIAALATDDFPLLVQTASQARRMSVDDEFRGGVEIVLRGLSPR